MGGTQKRILVACLIGLVLISAAFWNNKKYKGSPKTNDSAQVAVVKRSHIPIHDTDKDGVPDWQAQFVKGPPIIISKSTTTEYEIPETLTAKHGIEFFKEIITAEAYGVLDETQDRIINNSVEKLRREAQDTLYKSSDIKITENNDSEFLRSYGNLVALIIINNQTEGDNEYRIFTDAFNQESRERLKDLDGPLTSYQKIETALLDVSVPEKYQEEHLTIVNAFLALKNDVAAMQMVFEDPLYTFIRYKRYDSDVLGMSDALAQLYGALYLRGGIRFDAGDPVRELVNYTE